MTFKYVCEECNSKTVPKKRYSQEECKICGGKLKLSYFCRCKNVIEGRKQIRRTLDCPRCNAPIPTDRTKDENGGSVIFAEGKLRVNIPEKDNIDLENIEKVSLNFKGIEIGEVESPSFAKFDNIDDFEENGEGVDIDLGVTEEKVRKLLRNIKKG